MRGQSSRGFYALKMFPKTKRGIAAFTNEKEILKEIYPAHNPYIVELNCLLQTPVRVCVTNCSIGMMKFIITLMLFWRLRKWLAREPVGIMGSSYQTQI